jgi:hypothetical protein
MREYASSKRSFNFRTPFIVIFVGRKDFYGSTTVVQYASNLSSSDTHFGILAGAGLSIDAGIFAASKVMALIFLITIAWLIALLYAAIISARYLVPQYQIAFLWYLALLVVILQTIFHQEVLIGQLL